MKVRDVMHKGVTCTTLETGVNAIAKQMRDADVGVLPVKVDGRLVGMITDRDIVCRGFADGRDLHRLTAKDLMTPKVICVSPEDDVAKAIKTMESKKVRRLPVTDETGEIVGMVSLGDISHRVDKQISGEVLRAVSSHHS